MFWLMHLAVLRKHAVQKGFIYIYIYIYIHTHTHIYVMSSLVNGEIDITE